jgi:hypothetical protein
MENYRTTDNEMLFFNGLKTIFAGSMFVKHTIYG